MPAATFGHTTPPFGDAATERRRALPEVRDAIREKRRGATAFRESVPPFWDGATERRRATKASNGATKA